MILRKQRFIDIHDIGFGNFFHCVCGASACKCVICHFICIAEEIFLIYTVFGKWGHLKLFANITDCLQKSCGGGFIIRLTVSRIYCSAEIGKTVNNSVKRKGHTFI